MSLSTLLVQREVATIRDVEEAVARQVLYGGDLVTNLLESAKVDEEKLVEVLGEVTHLRPAGAGELPRSSEHARGFVPREVAHAYAIFPLGVTEDGEQLIVAVAEPLTPENDEKLMFELGLPLVQRVAPLVRVREALTRDYGLALDPRFDRLVRRLRGEPMPAPAPQLAIPSNTPPKKKPIISAPPTPATIAEVRAEEAKPNPALIQRSTINRFPAPQGVTTGSPMQARKETPQSAPTRTLTRDGMSARPPRRRRGPLTFDAAKRELDATSERDALLDLFFDFARQYFDYSALFVVHGDVAEGRDAFGSGATRDRVATIGVPLDLPGVLSVAKERAVPVVAVPSETGIDSIFCSDIGRPPRAEVIVVPLVLRRRTVALLYGDSHDGGAVIENPSDVTTFALLVGQAFERLIVKKKAGSSDRALQRFVQVPARDVATDNRKERALALSRALQDQTTGLTEPAPPPSSVDPEYSPTAISVPPPGEVPVVLTGSVPAPPNVLVVRRPSGPPIPREDPDDPTSRPPEVFSPPRASQPPARPSQIPNRASQRPMSQPPIPRTDSDDPPNARAMTDLVIPPPSRVPGDAPISPVAFEAPAPTSEPEPPQTLASPQATSEPPPRPSNPARLQLTPEVDEDGNEDDHEDVARGGPSSQPPARIEAEELAPAAAQRVLAEIEGEEIDDDMIEEASPVSTIPPSQTIVVAPHRPPTSRTDTENLPTIIVDVSAELEVLVRDIASGKNEERAEQELLRQGAQAMPAILASFPGPTRNEPTNDQESFPPFSTCGPVLRLIAAQRRVALPYVLPFVTDPDETRRFWATFSLTELAYPESLPAIVPRLFDESARVRKAARLAVGATSRVHGEYVARELGRYARDVQNDRRRRVDVMRLLQDVREPLAVPTFIALLDDGDPEIATHALHALEVISRHELGGDPKRWKSWWNANSSRHRVEWLIDALMHDSLAIRKAASDELKAITKEYFGYYPDESKRDREKAQARYREWWANEGRLKFVVS